MDTSNSTTRPWQKDLNQALTTIAGSLSICGSILIFISFALCREMRTNTRRILVFISIGDLLTAMVNISGVSMPSADHPHFNLNFCEAQAFINIAAILSSFFWTVYLSLFLYLALCGMRSESERWLMFMFHITAWGIPLAVAISAAIVGGVGNVLVFGPTTISDGWCWVSHKLSSDWMLFWMLVAGKGWEILAYLAITVFYIKAKLLLKQKVCASSSTPFLTTASLVAARKADRKFTFIPIVFIVLRMWGTVRFLRYAACLPDCKGVGPKPDYLWLKVLHGIGDSSQGFANFLIFCLFTDKIRSKVKFWCSKVCPFVQTPAEADGKHYRFESTNTVEDLDRKNQK